MDGILVINKPAGCTSHDVVSKVRRRFGVRRVGHAGTLDPLAEGLLVMLIGRATRLSEFVSGHDKEYCAGLLLGLTTDTQDIEGRILTEVSAADLQIERLLQVLDDFRGTIQQTPPMYSAVKMGGERLYRLAREGKTVERKPRVITVRSLDIDAWQPGEHARAVLRCVVSAGTYIRTLCSDIGESLGVGGCMEWLVRTASGPFSLDDAHHLEDVERWSASTFREKLLPAEQAIQGMPRVDLDSAAVRQFCCGGLVRTGGDQDSGVVRVHTREGRLLGIGQVQAEDGGLKPLKVLSDVEV